MKKHNIYKGIVMGTAACIAAVFMVRAGKSWCREQKYYEFFIRSGIEVTEETVKQLENISGICRFEPIDIANVTIQLGEYTMETELQGIDMKEYSFEWSKAEKEVFMGNTLSLFWGEGSFGMFSDSNGRSPGKSQIVRWKEHYQELSLSVTDEKGNVQKAKISGILKESGQMVCMEKTQMEEILKGSFQVTGGYLKIWGYENARQAKELLESAGYHCYEN